MPSVVSECDLVLSTSEYEGWPNCVKEALACNVPFIATDVSDLSEIAKRHSNCRIVKPDPESISKQIIQVLSLPKNNLLRQEVMHMSYENTKNNLFKFYNHSTLLS